MLRTRTLFAAALVTGALTLAACGGDDADPAPAGTEQETDDSMVEDEEMTDDSMVDDSMVEDEEMTDDSMVDDSMVDDSMVDESTTTGG